MSMLLWAQQMERASFSPVFILGPSLVAQDQTEELKQCMIPYGAYESKSEANRRVEVLGALHLLVQQWIKEQSLKKGLPAYVAHSAGGLICPFGSYRLRVHPRFAEIDILCVAPRHIQRSDFDTSLYELLKGHPQVTELRALQNAYVPVIKMTLSQIRINLLFASVDFPKIPVSLNLRDDTLLKNMDYKCVRSVNCYRATEEILRLVPNVSHFRGTLRAVKLWAQRRGVFSNTLGFLDDVSLAMLVAYTCQLYPDSLPSTLVHKFFCVLAQWKWPQLARQKHSKAITMFPFWDATVDVSHFFESMRIVTPLYPEHTSTFNMSKSTRTIVMEEIKIGLTATVDILLNKRGWADLFESTEFFSQYKYYLVLMASFVSPEDQLQGRELVETKIPNLIQSLDGNSQISLAHLNPECYRSVPLDTNDGQPLALPLGASVPADRSPELHEDENGEIIANYSSMWFIGLVLEKSNPKVDVKFETRIFRKAVNSEAETSNILKEGILIETELVERGQLYQYVSSPLLLGELTSPSTELHSKNHYESRLPKKNQKVCREQRQ
ncbi:unnamed protein product [Spodoptera exigua]|nr:unnamed protein product [Spodoptera exigua]